MENKTTDDLKEELMSQDSLEAYINENRAHFLNKTISELLSVLYEKKDISKAELARKAGMSEVYLHQVFSGRRKPSRDRLLCLCIGLGATMEEIQQMLRQAAFAEIYPRNKRDAIISYGILHGMELGEINDRLFQEQEKTLF